MASANFDALHLKLSRSIADPVAVAATDGDEATSALRTDYLNRANSMVQQIVLSMGNEAVNRLIPGLVTTDATATSGGSKSLPSDYSHHLAAQKASGARMTWVPPEAKADLDVNANPNLTLAYTVVGGSVYMYEDGTTIANGAHVLYYVKNDQRAQAGDSADIDIDNRWYSVLVDYAAHLFYGDKGDTQKSASKLSDALSSMKLILQSV